MSNKFIEDCEECQNMKKDGISFADAHWSLNPGYIQKPRGWVKSPHNNYAPAHQHEIVSIIRCVIIKTENYTRVVIVSGPYIYKAIEKFMHEVYDANNDGDLRNMKIDNELNTWTVMGVHGTYEETSLIC